MTINTATPRSRRALLAAALGAGAATVASALGRPLPGHAANGDPLILGQTNTATAETTLLANSGDVLIVKASLGGRAISGSSDAYSGVVGSSLSPYDPAILGINQGLGIRGTGVAGISGPGAAPRKQMTGVFGQATRDATCTGVWGRSPAGRGVYGEATTGYGVRGYATSGTAMYAGSANPMAGYALRAVGRVRLDNCAGIATIASGANSTVVSPGVDLVTTSAVVATLQGDAGGLTSVMRVSIDPAADAFTIYLTDNSTAAVKVAWHVFG